MSSLVLLVAAGLVAMVGGQDYCSMSCDGTTHTVCSRQNVNCGAGPACGSKFQQIPFSTADKQLVLDVHNELRNKVATGNERSYKAQPSASNMKALSYNSQLAYIAQCWTNGCDFKHDSCRKTASYNWVGQNLGSKMYSSPNSDIRGMINSTIRSWYNEVKDFDPSWVSSFQSRSVVIGHYTQTVWAETKEVGCGMTYYFANNWHNYFLACNYGPGGNMIGSPVYKTGSPGSACSGLPRNSQYSGLCGSANLA